MSSSDSSDSSFFASAFFSSAGAAALEWAGPPASPVGPVRLPPTLQMRLPRLTLARASANKPGQKGSTFTRAALMRALILPSVAVTSLAVQTGGRVDAGELGDRGRGAGERWAAGCRPRRHSRRQSRLKGGPHARAASASSEAPSTFSAAEERHSFLFFWSKTKIPTARTDLKNLAFLQVSLKPAHGVNV